MRQVQDNVLPADVNPLPPLEELRRLFDLDEATGELRWKVRDDVPPWWNGKYAGKVVGSLDYEGYQRLKINRRGYYAHRVVYALANNGRSPPMLDHVNGVRDDNRPSNLRPATRSNNNCNSGGREGSSQYCGVHWREDCRKWHAYIKISRKQRHLGYFDTEEDAARAYDAAAIELHGEFARLNFPRSPVAALYGLAQQGVTA